MNRDVAVVAFAQDISPTSRADRNEVELLMPVLAEALGSVGMVQADVGMTFSGSCDFISGEPFSFIWALGAIGAVPPVRETHLEMDGAFALYEAWIRLQLGDIDTALVYAFGKPTQGDLGPILALQLDPYVMAPLWPPRHALAALQAQVLVDHGRWSERDFAGTAWRAEHGAPAADGDVDALLVAPAVAGPLRQHDCPVPADGAAVVVLAAGDRARELRDRPAWITGMEHRIESGQFGVRDLTRATSAMTAAQSLGIDGTTFDRIELSASYSHEELLLLDALGGAAPGAVGVRPGRLDPLMVTGLIRIGSAADAVFAGAERSLAHAASGPCLQHNLLCALEGR